MAGPSLLPSEGPRGEMSGGMDAQGFLIGLLNCRAHLGLGGSGARGQPWGTLGVP